MMIGMNVCSYYEPVSHQSKARSPPYYSLPLPALAVRQRKYILDITTSSNNEMAGPFWPSAHALRSRFQQMNHSVALSDASVAPCPSYSTSI